MRYLILIILILYISSCTEKKELEYFWISSADNIHFDTIHITSIRTDSLPSGAKTIEYFSEDTIAYFVRMDTLLGSQTNRFKNIDPSLRLYSDTLIISGKDAFWIFKYIQNEDVEDGGKIHYWEKSIGIYSVHSTTWPGLTKLQTNDTILNEKINLLIDVTVPKFFIPKQNRSRF